VASAKDAASILALAASFNFYISDLAGTTEACGRAKGATAWIG